MFSDLTNIQEGDDVYFECRIVSNPEATKLEWYHEASFDINFTLCQHKLYLSPTLSRFQEQRLVPNASGGILLSNQSLVIQVSSSDLGSKENFQD